MEKSKKDEQEKMRTARTSGAYDEIWQNTGKCVFCDLKQKYIIAEENGIALTISLFPYLDGHMMAIPRRHVVSPKELSPAEWETIRKFNYVAKKLLKKVHGHKAMWSLLREGGSTSQMSVQGHLHMHFIPFDNPDLCVWNYRELKHTPLENAGLYQQEEKELGKLAGKFTEKYAMGSTSSLPINCNAILVNSIGEILLQERKSEFKLQPDYLTLPGGQVNPGAKSLPAECAREIAEETGLRVKPTELTLLDSDINSYSYANPALGKKTAVMNTYYSANAISEAKVVPGDDCADILFVKIDKALKHHRLSEHTKLLIKKYAELRLE